MKIRILLADDHEIVRAGTTALLMQMPEVEVVADVRNGEELLAMLSRVEVDLVITDLSMPGLDGLTALTRIRERHPQLRVLVLSMHEGPEFIKRAVACGASGYVMKAAAPEELQHAVRSLASTGSYFSHRVAQLLLQQGEPMAEQALTERQIQILVLLAQGKSSKEIAYELGLSSKTVDVHRARIMARLKVNDIASLTRYALRKGLTKL